MCFLLVFFIILTDLVSAASASFVKIPKIKQPTDQTTSVTHYSVNLIYPIQPVTTVVRFMYWDEKYNISVF